MPFSAILHRSYRYRRPCHSIRSCFHTFQLGRSDSQLPPAFLFCPPERRCCHFYRSFTVAQKGNYDELRRLFRQHYQPNADVLKAETKSFRQLPGQDVSAFYRTLHDPAGKACTNNAVHNELLLTIFIQELAKSVVRWEVQKVKPTVAEDTLDLALETQSYINLHGQQLDTSAASFHYLTGLSPFQSELFSDLIFTIKEGVKPVEDERSGLPH